MKDYFVPDGHLFVPIEVVLSTGFVWACAVGKRKTLLSSPISSAFWLQPVSLIWLVLCDDGSNAHSQIDNEWALAGRDSNLGYQLPPFYPASGNDY